MAPYKALYGRKCQSPLCWYEAGEASMLGLDLVAKTTKKIKQIMARILTAQSRQKRIGRAIRTKKLNSRFIGPFEYTSDTAHVLEPESVELKENLTFQVTQVRIDDTSMKKLHRKEVLLVKVAWKRAGVEEHTRELDLEMRKDYLELFSGIDVSDIGVYSLIFGDLESGVGDLKLVEIKFGKSVHIGNQSKYSFSSLYDVYEGLNCANC
ncbi:uncharacterized protein [Arachis hypogaea]|uniref:uncharacterized protein n=1 Tax=Arachis hypogaea TaxID=3818 RepID=UPI003B20F35F